MLVLSNEINDTKTFVRASVIRKSIVSMPVGINKWIYKQVLFKGVLWNFIINNILVLTILSAFMKST